MLDCNIINLLIYPQSFNNSGFIILQNIIMLDKGVMSMNLKCGIVVVLDGYNNTIYRVQKGQDTYITKV